MRFTSTFAAAALTAVLTQGCHTQPPIGSTLQTGKVEGVYVEAYNGVFVERQLARDVTGKALCAYVVFASALPDGRTFATAHLPEALEVGPGDLVQVRVADPGNVESDGAIESNQVMALVAKSTTQAARNFGQRDPSFTASKLSALTSERL
jgi:hypothetical protein